MMVTKVMKEMAITSAVFNSKQIKLADGTNTTFDSNNPEYSICSEGNLEKTKI
jgi:hypothetical protein